MERKENIEVKFEKGKLGSCIKPIRFLSVRHLLVAEKKTFLLHLKCINENSFNSYRKDAKSRKSNK